MNKPLKFKDIQVNQYYWDSYERENVFVLKKGKSGKHRYLKIFGEDETLQGRKFEDDRFYSSRKDVQNG